MNGSTFHKVGLLLLTAALMFGQVGAGFFHNKHDAHQTITDLDNTVLVPHGEHCKICSVDWVHQFVSPDLSFETIVEQPQSFEHTVRIVFISFSQSRASDRAPPVIS